MDNKPDAPNPAMSCILKYPPLVFQQTMKTNVDASSFASNGVARGLEMVSSSYAG
jgi:hypothetical protein